MAELSPSQTVGPFFHDAILRTPWRNELVPLDTQLGEVVRLQGLIRREGGRIVDDALIEMWQAQPDGSYCNAAAPGVPSFAGFGRAASDAYGLFEFVTLRPGPVTAPDGSQQAPHVNLHLFARGLMDRLATRIYFPDGLDPAHDPVLASVDAGRRSTLIAERTGDDPVATYRIELLLRGENETVFFAV